MEIKKIIKAGSTEIDSQQNATLQPTDTVYSALNLFLKSKATCLPVYENNEFLGSVILTDLLEVVLQDYALEREKRYQLTVKLNYSLIRLQNLIGKIKNASLPNDRGHLIQLSLETIADSQKHLK